MPGRDRPVLLPRREGRQDELHPRHASRERAAREVPADRARHARRVQARRVRGRARRRVDSRAPDIDSRRRGLGRLGALHRAGRHRHRGRGRARPARHRDDPDDGRVRGHLRHARHRDRARGRGQAHPGRGLETSQFQDDLLDQLLDLRALRTQIEQTKTREELARTATTTSPSTAPAPTRRRAPTRRTASRCWPAATPTPRSITGRHHGYQRNARWIPQLEKLFADGGMFVAVGADHRSATRAWSRCSASAASPSRASRSKRAPHPLRAAIARTPRHDEPCCAAFACGFDSIAERWCSTAWSRGSRPESSTVRAGIRSSPRGACRPSSCPGCASGSSAAGVPSHGRHPAAAARDHVDVCRRQRWYQRAACRGLARAPAIAACSHCPPARAERRSRRWRSSRSRRWCARVPTSACCSTRLGAARSTSYGAQRVGRLGEGVYKLAAESPSRPTRQAVTWAPRSGSQFGLRASSTRRTATAHGARPRCSDARRTGAPRPDRHAADRSDRARATIPASARSSARSRSRELPGRCLEPVRRRSRPCRSPTSIAEVAVHTSAAGAW